MGETQQLTPDPFEEDVIIVMDGIQNEPITNTAIDEGASTSTTIKRHAATTSEISETTTSGDEIIKIPPRPSTKKTKTKEVREIPQEGSEDSESTSRPTSRERTEKTETEEQYKSRRLATLVKAKIYIENANNPFSLTVNDLDNLLEKCQNSKNIMESVTELTTNIDDLSQTLKNIKPFLKDDKRTKTWIGKITTKITELRESQALILDP